MAEFKPKKVERRDAEVEADSKAALGIACPNCRAGVRVPCRFGGAFGTSLHPERIAEAREVPWRNRETNLRRREWRQRRADPTLIQRYESKDEAA